MVSDPIHAIARILAQANVRYAIIGGHAVNAWLEPRFTADIDVTVQASQADIALLRDAFGVAGYQVTKEHGAGQPSGPDFVRLVSSDGVIVELQVSKTAFQAEVVRRAAPDEEGTRIATPEDLLVLKLIANRSKDQGDLHGLVTLPDLDWSYVEHWCREWGVLAELTALRKDASLNPD